MKKEKKIALITLLVMILNMFSPYSVLFNNISKAATGVLGDNPIIINNLGVTKKGSNKILTVEIAAVTEAVLNGFDFQFKIDKSKITPCNKNTGASTTSLGMIMAQSDYFLSYYDPNVLYWVNGTSNNASKSLSNSDNGNSWAMNNNCLDARTFNNAQYLVLVSTAHFPQWGGTPYLYMYDVTSDGSFTGTVSTSDALSFDPSLSSFGSADGVAATGDVLLAPTTDGYKLRLYYVDNNCKIIGGYEFDCIDK